MSATGPDRQRRPGPRLTLSGFLVCRTLEEADRVAALLPEHTRLSRAEAGCLRFEVWRSQADPCRFAVSECFRDRAAFEAHQARAATTVWARATKGIPRDYVIRAEGEDGSQPPGDQLP
ncbi:putative quinol monooxygenase [Albidovulum sp.]|jgi:quinol monooxygenase YgiN|uniref:putative quinol monooxygenase n=1 Tax=Albidovulum sp. TaxID=1872424 RepID=UPI00304A93BA